MKSWSRSVKVGLNSWRDYFLSCLGQAVWNLSHLIMACMSLFFTQILFLFTIASNLWFHGNFSSACAKVDHHLGFEAEMLFNFGSISHTCGQKCTKDGIFSLFYLFCSKSEQNLSLRHKLNVGILQNISFYLMKLFWMSDNHSL